MTDTYEPQAITKNGNIIITGWDAEYTVEAASALIGDIAIAIKEARRQLAAIVEACAEGHLWGDGRNRSWGEKVTAYDCQRPGCTWSKTEPGWLPFEPKQHLVPYSSKLWDCTGPGCEHCGNEALADAFNRNLASAVKKLNGDFLPLLGDKAAGLAFDTTPLVVKKFGHTWSVDATPEQVQAALDARDAGKPEQTLTEAVREALGPGAGARAIDEWWASRPRYDGPRGVIAAIDSSERATGGIVSSNPGMYQVGERDNCHPLTAEDLKAARDRMLANPWPRGQHADENPERTKADYVQFGEHRIPIAFNPDTTEDEMLVVGSCSCGHPAILHGQDGCAADPDPQGSLCRCPCTTDVTKLAAKITEIGES